MKILHDIHTHNIFSSCCADRGASTDAYIAKEAELGIRIFGLSNHIWDERVRGASGWYRPQSIAKAEEAKNAFGKAPDGMRVLFGAETEFYASKGILGMTEEGAEHFDYLLVPHSHIHMRGEVMRDIPEVLVYREDICKRLASVLPELSESQISRMANTMSERDILPLIGEISTDMRDYICAQMTDSFYALLNNDTLCAIASRIPVSIAHPFAPCGVPHAQKNSYLCRIPDAVFADCFARAAEKGIYIEINVGAVKEFTAELSQNEAMRMLKIAKEQGCSFTFGTDSHSIKGLEEIAFGSDIANALSLTKDDIAEYLREGVEE